MHNLSMDEFIEIYREDIEALMGYHGMGFNADQEDIETFIMNNEELFNLAIYEGVDL